MAPPRSTDVAPPREQLLLEAMRGVKVSFRLWMREGLAEKGRGLTAAQYWTLNDIDDHGPLNAAQLAGLQCVTPPTISVVVDQLVREGFVAREPSAKDRRSVLLTVTPKGRAVLESVWAYVGEQLTRGTRDFPARDLDAVVRVLGALQAKARASVVVLGAA